MASGFSAAIAALISSSVFSRYGGFSCAGVTMMTAFISQVLAAQCFADAVTLIDGTADGFFTHATDLQELPQHRLCLLELSVRR